MPRKIKICCILSNPVLKWIHNQIGEAYLKNWKNVPKEIPRMREFLRLWGKIQKAF
jgi:hypothetical protein